MTYWQPLESPIGGDSADAFPGPCSPAERQQSATLARNQLQEPVRQLFTMRNPAGIACHPRPCAALHLWRSQA